MLSTTRRLAPPLLRRARSLGPTVASLLALALFKGTALAAQPPVGLGTADSFAVLAGQTVTNTGPTTINGDLGVSPGTAIPGFPPGLVNGTIHAADAVALQAQSDLTTAYNDAAGRTPPALLSADLGGLTLTAGVYKAPGCARADRGAHARRPGRPQLRLHLPGRLDADHRVREPREPHQRRAALQRLLAGRQLRDVRDDVGLRRQRHGPDVDLAEQRRHPAGAGAGAQRQRHADQRHDHRRALRARHHRWRRRHRADRRRVGRVRAPAWLPTRTARRSSRPWRARSPRRSRATAPPAASTARSGPSSPA